MINNLIHKVAVVRYNNHTAFETLEVFFQNIQGNDIQIVGRLIQYQKVRITHQDRTQVKTTALSSTQFTDITMLRFRSKQEMLQEL